jgi:hypothetical protein
LGAPLHLVPGAENHQGIFVVAHPPHPFEGPVLPLKASGAGVEGGAVALR